MKKSTAILWIAVAGIIAVVFCVLFISGSIRNEAQIEVLKSDTVNQEARIREVLAVQRHAQIYAFRVQKRVVVIISVVVGIVCVIDADLTPPVGNSAVDQGTKS